MFARLQKFEQRWRGATITILLTTLLIIILRLLGILELLEWKTLDLFFVNRLLEVDRTKIVLVTVTENDINYLQEYPLSDVVLTTLLEKIKQQKPSVIGLDIFRDFSVPSKANNLEENQQAYSDLLNFFRSTPNLIGIAKITNSKAYPSVNPSSVLRQLGQVSAADIVVDDDGVVRRGNLFPITDGSANSSTPSLGLAVALNYLATRDIKPLPTKEGWLKLKDTVFLPFQGNDGGYIRTDDNGYQILLNWHSCKTNYFPRVTVREVLQERIPKNLFRERIVLVGNQAVSVKDDFITSCSQGTGSTPNTMAGVEIQAHLADQIISKVLQERPLLKVWSEPTEYLWSIFWIGTVAVWGWKQQQKYVAPVKTVVFILIFAVAGAIVLICSSYLLFLYGWWVPLVPTLLGIGVAAVTIIGSIYIVQLIEANKNLEVKVANRTEELEKALAKLRQFQQQLIIQEKQVSLGTLSARIAHQIKNPLSLIDINISSSLNYLQALEQMIEENSLFFNEIIEEIFQHNEQIIPSLKENLTDTQKQIIRVNQIIKDVLSYFHQEQLFFNLTPLNRTISEVLWSIAKQYNEIPVKLETDYDRSIEQIEIVSHEFKKALTNLLENAYYAVRSKQSEAELDYIPTITVKTFNLHDRVEIRIWDNGEGIAEHLIPKIFDPFWTTKAAQEGTGLGLFFVHQIIVQMHGGKIKVRTVVGEYSEFIIELTKNCCKNKHN